MKVSSNVFRIGGLLFFMLFLKPDSMFSQRDSIPYNEAMGKENFGRFRFVEIKGHSGAHLYTGNSLNEQIESGYGAVEVRFGWQPSNESSWSNPYGFASYGVGWYSGFIGNPQVFGNPNALYGFMNFHLSRYNKKNVMELTPAFGLTYGLEPFDSETNPLNDAIGARMAVYFNLHYGGAYRLNREMDLLYGIDFTHFSNGRSYQPNYGLNMLGINVGIRYHYNADQRKVDNDPYTNRLIQSRFRRPKSRKLKENRNKRNSLNIHTAIGTVQNEGDEGTSQRYTTFSGMLDYRYKFNEMSGVTIGFDLFHDPSLEPEFPNSEDWYMYAVHAGYDFMFWRLAIRVQLGTYLGSDRNKNSLFIRPALQLEITKWMHTQVGLKTRRGAAADWVEFGIGFTPFQW